MRRQARRSVFPHRRDARFPICLRIETPMPKHPEKPTRPGFAENRTRGIHLQRITTVCWPVAHRPRWQVAISDIC